MFRPQWGGFFYFPLNEVESGAAGGEAPPGVCVGGLSPVGWGAKGRLCRMGEDPSREHGAGDHETHSSLSMLSHLQPS